MEAVRSEASRYGVTVHHSELVGLIPQDALRDSAAWYLQLDGFQNDQILEEKLHQVRLESGSSSSIPGKDFVDQLAAGTPTQRRRFGHRSCRLGCCQSGQLFARPLWERRNT